MMVRGHSCVPAIGTIVLLSLASCLAEEKTQQEPRQLYQRNPVITCPGAYNQLFQDPSDCSSYYVCNNDRLTRRNCQAGQVYSPARHACGNFPPPRGCQSLGLTQGGLQTQAEHEPTYRCPQSHGNFQDTEDCSSYYVCTNFQAHRRQCPNGQMFDPHNEVCSNIHNPLGCHRQDAARGQLPGSGLPGSCNQINAASQDANDCSKYFVCVNYRLQSRSCPTGQVFDPIRSACGYTRNPSGCRMPVLQDRQDRQRYQCPTASGQFQDRTDCSKYYVCTNWRAERRSCSNGQLFDLSRGACGSVTHPGDCQVPAGWRPPGGATWRRQPTGGETWRRQPTGGDTWRRQPTGSETWRRQPTGGATYRCPQASGQFPDRTDCSKYYVCTNWRAERRSCPSGQLFDPSTRCGTNRPGDCQMPANWRGTGETAWSGQLSGTDYTCPAASGEFPFQPDCSRFLRCDNFTATVMSCPGHLLFNREMGYCDWPNDRSSAYSGCTIPNNRVTGSRYVDSRRYY